MAATEIYRETNPLGRQNEDYLEKLYQEVSFYVPSVAINATNNLSVRGATYVTDGKVPALNMRDMDYTNAAEAPKIAQEKDFILGLTHDRPLNIFTTYASDLSNAAWVTSNIAAIDSHIFTNTVTATPVVHSISQTKSIGTFQAANTTGLLSVVAVARLHNNCHLRVQVVREGMTSYVDVNLATKELHAKSTSVDARSILIGEIADDLLYIHFHINNNSNTIQNTTLSLITLNEQFQNSFIADGTPSIYIEGAQISNSLAAIPLTRGTAAVEKLTADYTDIALNQTIANQVLHEAAPSEGTLIVTLMNRAPILYRDSVVAGLYTENLADYFILTSRTNGWRAQCRIGGGTAVNFTVNATVNERYNDIAISFNKKRVTIFINDAEPAVFNLTNAGYTDQIWKILRIGYHTVSGGYDGYIKRVLYFPFEIPANAIRKMVTATEYVDGSQ